ncbi:hypothetical protein CMI37_36805 [Candidatus Pacearchaeota archaeon]|nr:hypothetical protein [Candidatus Pacearchaeota archaeon]|tara:strand:- start:3463 stop:3858 length:396 start_codon:yes stop_codon:yes gene_type:complete
MGFLAKILGSGVTETAKGIADVVDRFVETKEEKKAASILLMKVQQEPDRWQSEVNKIQAGHRTMFVSGARPFIMWICGAGLALEFVVNPILVWITGSPGPRINTTLLMDLVLAMLGLGAMRTYEKQKGLTR